MKALPYFRWYPADAETDEAYASLNDTELGFFHRCLNRAWVNGGLPADLNKLAFAMRVRRSYLDKVWQKVGKCFHHAQEGTRLVNRRQEEEREHAISKSIANQRIGNANATRSKRERNANAPQHALARADSSSDASLSSSSEVIPFAPKSKNGKIPAITSARFDEWIRPWPRNPDPEKALHTWVFCWSAEADAEIFACRDRFLASKDAAEGVCQNPDRFLSEQKQNNWKGRWPARAKVAAKESLVDRTIALMEDRISKGQRPI